MAEITQCQLCQSPALVPVLDWGEQPLAEGHDNDTVYPLALQQCESCGLIQLTYAVDQGLLFRPEHPYASGNTAALAAHFSVLAGRLKNAVGPSELIVDIGANDGTFLKAYGDDWRLRRLAVEPTNQIRKCPYPGYQEFFTAALARRIVEEHGQAKIITAANVIAHVPDPHDFADGLQILLANDGIAVIETHDVTRITEGLQVDTVYHEHQRYYSVATLSRLLDMHNLTAVTAEPITTHCGSTRIWAVRDVTVTLAERAEDALRRLHDMLASIDSQPGLVYGIGASTRATPLIFAAGIAEFITCVSETPLSEKVGLTMPGTSIPVVEDARLIEDQPKYALLFAWHIADTLIPKLRNAGYKGKFIVPLPEARIIDD